MTVEILFLSGAINRLVELVKQMIPVDNPIWESRRTFALLLSSFVLGAAAVHFGFPASNLFPTASSPGAGEIFTGIVVGGLANGFDWLGNLGGAVITRVQASEVKPAA